MQARGDFLEFDETFYLLIARSLLAGDGLTMNGLPQIAFPPLSALVDAGLGLLSKNLLVISRVASCLMGAATIFPAAALARRAFGDTERILTALLVAVMPSLITFVPVGRTYAESLYFGPEPLYVLLFLAAGLWLARASADRRPRDAALGGLLAGLTYLTRNEAVSFIAAGAALLAFSAKRRWLLALVFAGAAAVAAMPYLIYLHEVTGAWTLSGKTGSAVLIRESIVSKVRDGDPTAFEALHYGLSEDGTAMRSSYWGFDAAAGGSTAGESALFDVTFSSALENAEIYLTTMLPILIPWALWPFALVGTIHALTRRGGTSEFDRAHHGAMWSLLAMLVPSLTVCLLLFVEPRHHLYLVPLLAILSAHGFAWTASAVGPRLRRFVWGAAALVIAGLLGLTLSQLVLARRQPAELEYAGAIRRMGEAISRTLPPEEPIMTWHPALAYYADRPWRVMPSASLARIASYAARRNVRYLVFETAVSGPPPGGDPATPFSLVQIGGMTPERIAAGGFTLRRIESGPLFASFAMEDAAGGGDSGRPR